MSLVHGCFYSLKVLLPKGVESSSNSNNAYVFLHTFIYQ